MRGILIESSEGNRRLYKRFVIVSALLMVLTVVAFVCDHQTLVFLISLFGGFMLFLLAFYNWKQLDDAGVDDDAEEKRIRISRRKDLTVFESVEDDE